MVHGFGYLLRVRVCDDKGGGARQRRPIYLFRVDRSATSLARKSIRCSASAYSLRLLDTGEVGTLLTCRDPGPSPVDLARTLGTPLHVHVCISGTATGALTGSQ